MSNSPRVCPICKGKVLYTEMNKGINQPEMIQCVGDCGFEIVNDDYRHPGDNKRWFSSLMPMITDEPACTYIVALSGNGEYNFLGFFPGQTPQQAINLAIDTSGDKTLKEMVNSDELSAFKVCGEWTGKITFGVSANVE